MKYVKTKDGIYEIAEEIVNEYTNKFIYKTTKGYFYNEDKIKKVADTIEELFDELIIYDVDDDYQIIYDSDKHYSSIFNCNHILYGAIWTDKGLIYVAKMKDILPNGEIDWEII